MERRIGSLRELEAAAGEIVRALAPASGGATLVTLSGELGAGKTAFVQAAAKALGVIEVVNSPTFVLEKIYALPRETGGHRVSTRFARLVHIDAYRLERGDELAALGFDELMRDRRNLIFLEWPERVEGALPEPARRVAFVPLEDGVRMMTISP